MHDAGLVDGLHRVKHLLPRVPDEVLVQRRLEHVPAALAAGRRGALCLATAPHALKHVAEVDLPILEHHQEQAPPHVHLRVHQRHDVGSPLQSPQQLDLVAVRAELRPVAARHLDLLERECAEVRRRTQHAVHLGRAAAADLLQASVRLAVHLGARVGWGRRG